jgi:hypothetical protein
MQKLSRNRLLLWWLLALVCATVLFTLGIGVAPLMDRDEPAYAEAAREMLVRGDWIGTYFNGRLWFDKPPLVYWAEMVSFSLFGVNETAARLPIACFGILGLLAIYWVGRRLRGPRAGALAAGILATNLLYFGLSRTVLLDVPFTMAFTLAMGCLVAGIQEPERARWPLLTGLALGLAILAKTPAACVLFGLIMLATGLLLRHQLRFRGLRWGYAIITCLLVAVPWYAAMTARYGLKFLEEFLIQGNFGRFGNAEHAASATPFYYLPIILVGFMPWTPVLFGALRRAWRERRELAIPLLWAVAALLLYSASQSKLPGYILPMFPALALLVACDLDRNFTLQPQRGLLWASGTGCLLAVIILAFALSRAHEYLTAALLMLVMSIFPLVLLLYLQRRLYLAGGLGAIMIVLSTWSFGYQLLPALANQESAKEMGLFLRAQPASGTVYLLNTDPLHVPSLLFYSRRTMNALSKTDKPVLAPGDMLLIRKQKDHLHNQTHELVETTCKSGFLLYTCK